MPRPKRFDLPGIPQHVVQRGNTASRIRIPYPRRFWGWSRASPKSRYFGRGGIVGRVRGTAGRSQLLAQSARTEKRASKALDCHAK